MLKAGQQDRTVIAVATAGRPDDLTRLLGVLAEAYGAREDVELLLVDNDSMASSRPIFDEWTTSFGDRARYVVEPVRGYASARNAVLANVGDVTAIAMIDDDEVPMAGWLDQLLAVQRRTHADVVFGPVLSEFPADAPARFRQSRVFSLEVPALTEGAEMRWCASNNTLLRVEAARRVAGGFDARFNAMGGEDTHFFFRAHLAGSKIVWTNTAAVREMLPASRLDRAWIFRRAVRSGNNHALIELELSQRRGVAPARFIKAAGLLAFGIGCAGASVVRRDPALGLRALYRVGLAYGMLLAFISREPWGP